MKPVPDKHTNFVLLTCGDTFQFLCDSPKVCHIFLLVGGEEMGNLSINMV